MKQLAFKRLTLIGGLLAASSASAAGYTAHFDYVGKQRLANSQIDPQIQSDTAICNETVGHQYGIPSRDFRACMLRHGWKYTFSTWADTPSSSSNDDHWNDPGGPNDPNSPTNPNNPNGLAAKGACGFTC